MRFYNNAIKPHVGVPSHKSNQKLHFFLCPPRSERAIWPPAGFSAVTTLSLLGTLKGSQRENRGILSPRPHNYTWSLSENKNSLWTLNSPGIVRASLSVPCPNMASGSQQCIKAIRNGRGPVYINYWTKSWKHPLNWSGVLFVGL